MGRSPTPWGGPRSHSGPLWITVTPGQRRVVTVIDGFDDGTDLGPLVRELKQRLGAGGGVQNGRVELQGDHAARLARILRDMGFHVESDRAESHARASRIHDEAPQHPQEA